MEKIICTPFCDSYTQRVPSCPSDCLLVTITPAFTFILVTACGAKWAQDQEGNL